ncbi:MAG: hypothetical protein PHR11_05005 [Candidatus Omnitrophica bacterium]|nr:hypothetical protein [Candidatus Omnitrophota bacterium]
MKKSAFLFRRLFPEALGMGVLVLAGVLLFTWPLALHIKDALPTGSEPEAVALFQLYSMEWTAFAVDNARPYWDAPFFWPFRGAFSWSEPQPVFCLLGWALSKITGFVAAYNFLLLFYLVSFGMAVYAMARLFTRDRLAAFFAAFWCAAGAYSMQQICALPLLAGVFPVSSIFFGLIFIRAKRSVFFWMAVCAYLLTWGTCKQTALYLSMLLPVMFFVFFSRSLRRPQAVARWSLAFISVLAVLVPFSLWQLKFSREMGFERFLGNVRGVLHVKHLFMPAKGHWLATKIFGWEIYSWDLGVAVCALIVLAVCLGALRFYSQWDPFRKKAAAGLLFVSAAALFLAFGPRTDIVIGEVRLGVYQALFSLIPGFKFIRAPSRIVFFSIVGLAVLAAPAFAYLRGMIRGRLSRTVFSAACFGVLAAEIWVLPLPLVYPGKFLREHEKVDAWLKEYAGGSPLLELPAPVQLWPESAVYEAEAMLRALRHGNPVVNGYASFAPPSYWQLRRALENDPAGTGRRYLAAYGVRYVLLHTHRLGAQTPEAFEELLGAQAVYQDAGHWLFELPPSGDRQDADFRFTLRANFQEAPQADKIYAVKLPKERRVAVLITPDSGLEVYAAWKGKGGQENKKIRVKGGVLVDAMQPGLFFRINSGGSRGDILRATAMPAEEMDAFFSRKKDQAAP